MLMIMMIIEQLNAADYERWKYSSSHSDGDDHEIDHLVLIIIIQDDNDHYLQHFQSTC